MEDVWRFEGVNELDCVVVLAFDILFPKCLPFLLYVHFQFMFDTILLD